MKKKKKNDCSARIESPLPNQWTEKKTNMFMKLNYFDETRMETRANPL